MDCPEPTPEEVEAMLADLEFQTERQEFLAHLNERFNETEVQFRNRHD